MKLLRVDMKELQVKWEPVPVVYTHLGGRALIAKLLLEEIPPRCDALGPHNKLIVAPGLLGGCGVPAAGRLSVGAKSPLTGGVKEANAGGTAGDALGKLELKAVVVEGQPSKKELSILYVAPGSAQLLPAGSLSGLGTYATTDRLKEQYGPDCTVISIGQAGEYLLTGADIACTGEGDQRSNHAARGGLGAVMGSKGLKAIVIDKAEARSVTFADPSLFRGAVKRFAQELVNDPKLGPKGGTHLYGTAAITGAVNEMGSLPTRNFSSGNFEQAANLRGEHMREIILARGGRIGTRCMPGCVIACRNLYVDEAGVPIVGTLQYETIALLGSNLGLGNLDDVARLNYACNDYGLDTIETGAALGVAIEAGFARYGDFESIAGVLRQVSEGTALGRLIGCGAVVTGRVLGIRRVPATLGQAMPGYDPRSLKGNGVTYATSPMGADHTAGNAFGARAQVNPLIVKGQKELSLKLQIISAMLDSTGLCLFARPPVIADPQLMVDMLNGRYGWGWTKADLDQANREVLRNELEFNRRAGITAADYRIPEYMREEPLTPHQVTFDVPDSDLDSVFTSL
ncbi:MAG TPA: aldehyde ferredoxin oxidoreductase C-terminal domain-containing protein [Desulfobacterales bacterium]|nr:aldehyde ferredoxin oxidoreductase C-terminal domain-containing protein [Desulfobacterales bacterium]